MHQLNRFIGENIRDIILGSQDGLVNALGVVLGIAAASHETRLVLAAGLAAGFAQSFSMAAVAYTSTKAERDLEIRKARDNGIHLEPDHPLLVANHLAFTSAMTVGTSSILASILPILPFIFLRVNMAIVASLIVSALSLFILGSVKAHYTVGSWRRSGLEIVIIGMLAAFVGYIVGVIFKV